MLVLPWTSCDEEDGFNPDTALSLDVLIPLILLLLFLLLKIALALLLRCEPEKLPCTTGVCLRAYT